MAAASAARHPLGFGPGVVLNGVEDAHVSMMDASCTVIDDVWASPIRSPCGQLALVPGLASQYPPEGSGGEDLGFFPAPEAPRRRGEGCGASRGGPVTVWPGMRLCASGRPIVARRHKPLSWGAVSA